MTTNNATDETAPLYKIAAHAFDNIVAARIGQGAKTADLAEELFDMCFALGYYDICDRIVWYYGPFNTHD